MGDTQGRWQEKQKGYRPRKGKREGEGPSRVLEEEGGREGQTQRKRPTHLPPPGLPSPAPRKEIRRPLQIGTGHFHMLYSSNQNN